MEDSPPNIDHITVRVVGHRDRPIEVTLNTFLNERGVTAAIRVSSHYDYNRMRKYLSDEIGLPLTEPLVFNGTQQVRSQNELERLIIGIQAGITILPYLEGLALPLLVLHADRPASVVENDPSPEVNDLESMHNATAPPPGPTTPVAVLKPGTGSQPTKQEGAKHGPQSHVSQTSGVGNPASQVKRRKIQPQLLSQIGPGRQQDRTATYFRDAGLSSYDILHHECDSDCSCDERVFSFQTDRIYLGHSKQVNSLLKRATNVRGRYPAARHPPHEQT